MRVLRSPITQFLVVGGVTVGGIFLATNVLADRAASDEAIAEARATTQVLATSVVEPELTRAMMRLRSGALDQFDRTVVERLVDVETVNQINIWTHDGLIIYSTETALIGKRRDLDADQRRVLAGGGVGSEVSDPVRPTVEGGDAPDGDADLVVRTYTTMTSPAGEALLFEAYYTLDEIGERRSEIYGSFRWITIGPLVLLIAVVTLMLSALTRQLTSAGRERERLLRSAMDASDAERRRIARDLHDGVVQDLAGTAFSVSAVARHPATVPDARETLESAGTSLRSSLTSLRSLLAEIHPPDLHAEGLASALADLIAPADAAGIQASVSVEGAETASSEKVTLVWRVAQEAVRNAIRHSGASTLAVTVRGDGRCIALEVVDDGVGFDPAQAHRDRERYGLRGLRSLVTDSGGVLVVRSSPGDGTTVQMEVDAQ